MPRTRLAVLTLAALIAGCTSKTPANAVTRAGDALNEGLFAPFVTVVTNDTVRPALAPDDKVLLFIARRDDPANKTLYDHVVELRGGCPASVLVGFRDRLGPWLEEQAVPADAWAVGVTRGKVRDRFTGSVDWSDFRNTVEHPYCRF